MQESDVLARIPVSRGKGLERAALRAPPGILLLILAIWVVKDLRFSATGVSNRITDYSWAIAMIPVFVAGIALMWNGLRWLALSVWPAPVEIRGDRDGLVFALGSFGHRRYDLSRLAVRYAFEMSVDVEDERQLYLSLQPPDEQMRSLPQMTHPDERLPLHVQIMRFVRFPESEVARQLRPWIDYVRRDRPDPEDD